MEVVEIGTGGDTALELNGDNALVGAAPVPASSSAAVEPDSLSMIGQWKDSVVALWTARTHASGFVVDSRGLVVTNQRVIGDASTVEVQVTPSVKVSGQVLAAKATQDVAVLWVDPSAVGGIQPIPLDCESPATVPPDDDLSAIEVPLRGPKQVISDREFSPDATGGPVFTEKGELIGLTSLADGTDGRPTGITRVVSTAAVCQGLALARTKMTGQPPSGTHLPTERAEPVSAMALDALSRSSAFTLNPYRISSSDFEIAFITPVLLSRAQSRQEWMIDREDKSGVGAVTEFGDWSDYVAGYPPVLLVRVTPRLVEGFWMKVARGAAETQGMSMPPIKRLRPGFSHMRLLCGDKEVTPIHPFKVQRRISETEGTDEGLYVYDPAAIGPHCGTVKLELFSAKEPGRADTRVVDAGVVSRIAQDFAALVGDPGGPSSR
jgi:hypothetical protein